MKQYAKKWNNVFRLTMDGRVKARRRLDAKGTVPSTLNDSEILPEILRRTPVKTSYFLRQ